MEPSGLMLTNLQVVGGVSTLCLVIGTMGRYLWTTMQKDKEAEAERYVDVQKRLTECLEDHKVKNDMLVSINREIGELQGFKEGMELMTSKVLNAVTIAIEKGK